MTWTEILALTDDALDRAINQHIYGWPEGIVTRMHIGEAGAATLPRAYHAATWGHAMALAQRYGIDVLCSAPAHWAWVRLGVSGTTPMVMAESEAQAQRAVGQLALWRATQARLSG